MLPCARTCARDEPDDESLVVGDRERQMNEQAITVQCRSCRSQQHHCSAWGEAQGDGCLFPVERGGVGEAF